MTLRVRKRAEFQGSGLSCKMSREGKRLKAPGLGTIRSVLKTEAAKKNQKLNL